MRHSPPDALGRFALGTVQQEAQLEPMAWGLLAALRALDQDAVHLHSTSYLAPHDASRSLTGCGSRHLDSWAMSRSSCLKTLARACGHGELAMVSGPFDVAASTDVAGTASLSYFPAAGRVSSLDTVCDWLDLPRIAVIDVSTLGPCSLPPRPQRIDGFLLDCVEDSAQAVHWQTNLEALWQAPGLGWLDRAEALRSLVRTVPAGRDPSIQLCEALGTRLLKNLRHDRLLALAERAPLPLVPPDDLVGELPERRFRVALAYDEDCCGYFPDTLELLESAGAEICDFSPLRSGALPDGADVLYFGCGHPERRPDVLARNHCLQQSIRSFAANGGRIYGEGSGLAYLCREIVLPCGEHVPLTGLLPAIAHLVPDAGPPQPVEATFAAGGWLMDAGTTIRGYRHAGWQIEPTGSLLTYPEEPQQRFDIIGRGNVIGSRIMINLAANEHLLRRFIEPCISTRVASTRWR